MTYPTLAVKVSFGTDRFDTPSYTTLPAADVERLSIDCGRHSELDGANPGICDVGLDNSGREYDPRNASGSHYPNVTPGRRMRVEATRSGVTYQLFNGWTDAWPQETATRKLTRATMKSSGPFRFLARTVVPDRYGTEIATDLPVAWYRLGDSPARTMTDSSTFGATGPYHGRWLPTYADLNTTDGLIDSADPATSLPAYPTVATGIIPLADMLSSLPATSIELWLLLADVPTAVKSPALVGQSRLLNGGGFRLQVYGDNIAGAGGDLTFSVIDSPLSSANANTCDTLFPDPGGIRSIADGRPHHIVCVINALGTGTQIWIDGLLSSTQDPLFNATINNVPAWGNLIVNDAGGWVGDAVLDELAIYDTNLSSDRILAHYLAGLPEGDGDRTGERLDRVLDAISWPAGLRDIDSGQTLLAVSAAVGEKALDYLQLVADTEQAVLSEAHDDDGKVRFQDRSGRLGDSRSASVQTLFSDDPTDIASNDAVVYTAIGLPVDDRPVANVVTVRWPGADTTVEDATSIDTYGEIPVTVDTILTSRDQAVNLANWILDERSIPSFSRVQSVTLTPSGMNGTAADRAWTACLARKVGDRVRVKHTPTGSGTQIDHEAWIIGVEHKAEKGAEIWETTFYLSPSVTTTYWVLGTSQLGTDTRLMF